MEILLTFFTATITSKHPMPNDDLNVHIVSTEQPLPVEIKSSASLPISAKSSLPVKVENLPETFSVEVDNFPKTEEGLPKELRSGLIALRHGKKSMDVYRVQKTHGLWAYLTSSENDAKSAHKAGWYYLPALAVGPWIPEKEMPAKVEADSGEEEA